MAASHVAWNSTSSLSWEGDLAHRRPVFMRWSCPPVPFRQLVGDWRIFFDTGAVRRLVIRRLPRKGQRGADLVASMDSVGFGAVTPQPAPLVREVYSDGYTVAIPALEVPAILGQESTDHAASPRLYRMRGRFCAETAVLEAFDLSEGARESGLQWALRQAVGVRGAAPSDVPLVVPGHLLGRAFEWISYLRSWNPIQLAHHLAGQDAAVGFLTASDSGRLASFSLEVETSSWRQRLLPRQASVDSFKVIFANVSLATNQWDLLANGGFLFMGSGVTDGESEAARVGIFTGVARFGSTCFWLCYKLGMPRQPVPVFGGPVDRVVVPTFKQRGKAGANVLVAGVRLGNILFLLAASVALALDHQMGLRLIVSASWRQYFLEENGILSQLPATLWSPRRDDADVMLGSPPGMGYEPLRVPPDARIVMMHGYFQNPRYFSHRLAEVRTVLQPEPLRSLAASTWHTYSMAQGLAISGADAQTLLAVHVRRGDVRGWLGVQFYRAAIAQASARFGYEPVCVFFSDGTAEQLNDLAGRVGCDRNVAFQEDMRDDVVLTIMAICCAGIVISASTYSWWAAVLGGYSVVVAPESTQPVCSNQSLPFRLGDMPGWIQLPVPCS